MHRADTHCDVEQSYLHSNAYQNGKHRSSTEIEKKAFRFFDTSMEVNSIKFYYNNCSCFYSR